jgi:hypothetical protein
MTSHENALRWVGWSKSKTQIRQDKGKNTYYDAIALCPLTIRVCADLLNVDHQKPNQNPIKKTRPRGARNIMNLKDFSVD